MLGDAKTWQGAVTQLPDPGLNEQKAILIVSGYTDLVGNVGSQDETHFSTDNARYPRLSWGMWRTATSQWWTSVVRRNDLKTAQRRHHHSVGEWHTSGGVPAETATVTDGQWQSGTMDLSGLSNAGVSSAGHGWEHDGVTVSGSESLRQTSR